MTTFQLIYIISAAVILTAVISVLLTNRRIRKKMTYMLDALEDKELNFRFDEKRVFGRRMNMTLNRLKNIFDKERHEIIEQERYYGSMLDHVQTGVVVIDSKGGVNYCNATSLSILGMATFGHIRQLRTISEDLYKAFSNVSESEDTKASWYNERGQITISLTASQARIGGKSVKIAAFNDISSQIDENEQESWSKLIRVLTHEIMNTVTPIASLSDTLSGYLSAKAEGTLTDDESAPDIAAGLDTISHSARGLIKFVDTYRNLTRIAKPMKKAFFVRHLIEHVLQLTSQQTASNGVRCTYKEKTEDILLYADENQISQIMINLIKNACQAEASDISIEAEIDNGEYVIINVSNNGKPISKESQAEIFVPFYTTKQDGTGIGLSLSRQIMRLHNGSIRLVSSNPERTVFSLIFK